MSASVRSIMEADGDTQIIAQYQATCPEHDWEGTLHAATDRGWQDAVDEQQQHDGSRGH